MAAVAAGLDAADSCEERKELGVLLVRRVDVAYYRVDVVS
jgi:hypothetical protein